MALASSALRRISPTSRSAKRELSIVRPPAPPHATLWHGGAGPSYFGIEYTTGCPTLRDFRRVGTMLMGVPFLIFAMPSVRRFRAYATSRILSSAILGSFTTTGPDSLEA